MLTASKIGKSTFPKSHQFISDFDTFFLTKTEMYVVYKCYFRILISRTMSLNLHGCPFGIFNLFLISCMIAFLSCLHCYISEMLWILYSMKWTRYNMMWSNMSYYGRTDARCFLYLLICLPTIEIAALI